jgi:hypothetical protein
MKLYRKKPVIVEAVQFTGNNHDEIFAFLGYNPIHNQSTIHIRTLEGTMSCCTNDYVIKGVQGEFYPCKPDIFKQTYEEV